MHIPIVTHTLTNGLRVVISEDHTTPIAAVNLWYHVGSANERLDRTGFAHLFEHMLFQGSEHVDANEHFELIQRAGGTLNGSTWLERTNYYETVPSNQLALALWLEADRMGRLLPALTQQKLDTQRDVVKNERRWSVDNQPYGTWWEKLPALCFPPDHPFHHSLIGSMDDLTAATLEDVAEFFTTYYSPDNAVLSVVGDVDEAEVMQLVEDFFGGFPARGARPALRDTTVPELFGEWRREVVPDEVVVPRLFLAFRSPVFGSVSYPVASICGAVLGTGKGSRLYRTLVRDQQVATAATAYTFDLSQGSDLLILDVTARPGISAQQLEAAVAHEVDKLQRGGASDTEVERAVALVTTEFVVSMQSAQSRADKLSQYATYLGSPEILNQQIERFAAVTAAQVNAFASARLRAENRASLLYVPRQVEVKAA
jgi:predicted Zn-dependent peptidase